MHRADHGFILDEIHAFLGKDVPISAFFIWRRRNVVTNTFLACPPCKHLSCFRGVEKFDPVALSSVEDKPIAQSPHAIHQQRILASLRLDPSVALASPRHNEVGASSRIELATADSRDRRQI